MADEAPEMATTEPEVEKKVEEEAAAAPEAPAEPEAKEEENTTAHSEPSPPGEEPPKEEAKEEEKPAVEEAPKVEEETPETVEEPTEEPKAEEPKAEEPKTEEAEAEAEPKAEEPKQGEESKQEEEPKQEQKPEEKVEESETEEKPASPVKEEKEKEHAEPTPTEKKEEETPQPETPVMSPTSDGPVPVPRKKTPIATPTAEEKKEAAPAGDAPPPVAKKRVPLPSEATSPTTEEQAPPVAAKRPEMVKSDKTPETPASPPVAKKKPGDVANLAAQLKLPMSPMSGPPPQKAEPGETPSFDKPIGEIKTLENVTRGRARPQQKRRAPSRPLKLYLLDGTYRGVNLEESSKISWLVEYILEKLELEETPKDFGIYQVDKSGDETRLAEDAVVSEIMDGWGEKKSEYYLFAKAKSDPLLKLAIPSFFHVEPITTSEKADKSKSSENVKTEKKPIPDMDPPEDTKKPSGLKTRSKSSVSLAEDADVAIIGKDVDVKVKFDGEQIVAVTSANKPVKSFPISIQNVMGISATTTPNGTDVIIWFLTQKKKNKTSLDAVTIKYTKDPSAQEFVENVKAKIVPLGTFKKLLVIINPSSGKKKSKAVYEKYVQPILTAAGIESIVKYTERAGHGEEMASQLKLEDQDAIVILSGDGLINEVVNGLLNRKDWARAVLLPIGVIPTGNTNGWATSLYGPEAVGDYGAGIISIIRGESRPVDTCSISQENRRKFSFLNQTYGMIADGEVGTEKLRFMGDARFAVGAFKNKTNKQKYQCKISMLVVSDDRAKISKGEYSIDSIAQSSPSTNANEEKKEEKKIEKEENDETKKEEKEEDKIEEKKPNGDTETREEEVDEEEEKRKLALKISASLESESTPSSPMVTNPPPVISSKNPKEGPPLTLPWVTESLPSNWKVFDEEIYFIFGSKAPYANKDLSITPYANATDSLLDICLLRANNVARNRAADITKRIETGGHIKEFNEIEYFKVKAYRLELVPNQKASLLVDGEKWNFGTYQVEAHPKLLNFIFPTKNQGKFVQPKINK